MPTGAHTIIKKLEEQERREGNLPELLNFYKSLLHIQEKIEGKITSPYPILTKDTVKAYGIAGKQLLGFDELKIDWGLLHQSYTEVVALFSKHSELFNPIPDMISSLSPECVINENTIRAWYQGQPIELPDSMSYEIQTLLGAIFTASIKPFLSRQVAALRSLLDPEMWRRGSCPICGGNPDFAYLARETGARWLVCSRCDTEWLFQRLQCPYCGSCDQNSLYYFSDGNTPYRLYVCDRCKHYLKVIDLRMCNEEVLFPLERLTTLDIDRQAQDKGYLVYT